MHWTGGTAGVRENVTGASRPARVDAFPYAVGRDDGAGGG
jgi:hypothetical protein